MMLPMLWRDCLGWLPLEESLQTLLRGMESKGVLTRMTMNMDGENCITIKKNHLFHPNVAGSHHVHGCPRHRPQAAAHGHQRDAVVARRRRSLPLSAPPRASTSAMLSSPPSTVPRAAAHGPQRGGGTTGTATAASIATATRGGGTAGTATAASIATATADHDRIGESSRVTSPAKAITTTLIR